MPNPRPIKAQFDKVNAALQSGINARADLMDEPEDRIDKSRKAIEESNELLARVTTQLEGRERNSSAP